MGISDYKQTRLRLRLRLECNGNKSYIIEYSLHKESYVIVYSLDKSYVQWR